MKKFALRYFVAIEAEDEDQAELMSIDLEGEIRDLHRCITMVDCDPYMEELE